MSKDLPPLQTIDLDGPLAYREWAGPAETTFVMVHGLGGTNVNWVRVAPGLAGLGRVLALDLPGFGQSPRAGRGSGMMDLRRTLSRFVGALGTGDVVLSGNSMGGVVSMIQAAVEPGSVHALVLTGAGFPRAHHVQPHPLVWAALAVYEAPQIGDLLAQIRTREIDAERVVRLGMRFIVADLASIPDDVLQLHVDAVRAHANDPDAGPAFVDAARSLLRLGRRPDAGPRILGNVAAPVLVLHGRRDTLVPAGWAEAALREHPAWRGRIFPDLGHVPMLEAPGRWLAEVADWLGEVR
ncbi:MAG: alpha/beta fold hydrolase [Actinomycetota bacterium]